MQFLLWNMKYEINLSAYPDDSFPLPLPRTDLQTTVSVLCFLKGNYLDDVCNQINSAAVRFIHS